MKSVFCRICCGDWRRFMVGRLSVGCLVSDNSDWVKPWSTRIDRWSPRRWRTI